MGAKSGRRGPDPGEGTPPPTVPVDYAIVRRASAIGCTNEEIAALAGVSRSHFYDRVKEDPDLRAILETGREEGRATLRRHQWQRATGGSDTMLIWLGKQLLGQRDKTEQEIYGKDGAPLIPVLNVKVNRE